MNEENRRIYTFDSFQVDPARRRLWRAGVPVQINSKTFELLLVLLEHSGQSLDKDRLLELVWPNQVVEEGNLTAKMSALRKILGERKDEARFIVTIPGRGYRFVADVKKIEGPGNALVIERQASTHIVVEHESESTPEQISPGDAATSLATTVGQTPSARSATRRKAILALVGTALLLLTGGFLTARYFRARIVVTPFERFEVIRQTNTGKALVAAISPNGQYFAFAQAESDGTSLWLQHVPTGGTQRIVDAAPVEYWGLTFTPDGNHIYATTFAESYADPALEKIPLFGGAVQTLPVVTNTAVAFAPDGSRMAYVVSSSSAGGSLLWTADADGSNKKSVALRRDPNYFAMQANTVAWSPHDDTLACVVLNNSSEGFYMTIVGYDANDGRERQLTAKRWNIVTSITWTSDGRGLLLTGNDAHGLPSQIWHVSTIDGSTRRITNDLNSYRGVSLTNDARTLLAVQTDTVSEVWTASTNQNTPSDFRQRFSEVGEIPAVGWTGDGRLIYQSSAGGTQELWLFEEAKRSKQLTVGSLASDFAISPDGRFLVVVSNRSGRPNLWRLNAHDGGDPRQLTRGDGEIWPRFASDSAFVFFQKGFGDVLSSAWKVSIEGGEPQKITEPHKTHPDVSPDGRQLVYSYMDKSAEGKAQWRLGVSETEGGTQLNSFPLPKSVTNRLTRWTPDGQGLTYLSTVGGVSNLWLQPAAGGPARQISHFDSHRIDTFDWSRDGKEIAIVRSSRTSDVVLLQNSRR